MSGDGGSTIGGASFDLRVSRSQFADDLAAAIDQARDASATIRDLFAGAGPTTPATGGTTGAGGGFGVASEDLRRLASRASSATDRLDELSTAIDRADS